MEDFLKQIQISEHAIKIYLNCLGRKPLSSNELYSIVPDISQKEFLRVIEELTANGLLIQITPENKDILSQYLILPPFNPIITYIANINANLDSIKNQLYQLLTKSLNKTFKDGKILEVDSILKATQDLRKDIQEETIIQKQEVEDIVQGMENLRIIEKILDDLHQTIKKVTQTQFGNLVKIISIVKEDINKGITSLELKKHEKEIKSVIEESFKKNLDILMAEFTMTLHNLIEEEINKTIESLNNIIDSSFQFRDDFKMLLLNTLNSFELKMTSIFDLLKDKKESLNNDLDEFQNTILKNLDNVIKSSVDSIAALNNPINNAMNNYRNFITPEKIQIEYIWIVNSLLKVHEEINNLITKAKENLLFIVPELENNLTKEQFKNIHTNLKINIASSEANTNSSVKKLKEIRNFEYRTLKNDSVFVLKSDDNYLIVGLISSGVKDKLNDFIGFGTNYKPIIQLLEQSINSLWSKATSDLYQTPKSIGISEKTTEGEKILESQPSASNIKIQTTKFTPTPIKLSPNQIPVQKPVIQEIEAQKLKTKISPKTKDVVQPPQQEVPPPIAGIDLSQQFQQHSNFMSKVYPEAGDKAGILINDAFNTLVKKLGTLKGEEFSEELQKVSDLILEKKGFSVTLHKLRSMINRYKEYRDLLTPNEVRQIIEDIEDWKSHLL